jgi:hypothetical protein
MISVDKIILGRPKYYKATPSPSAGVHPVVESIYESMRRNKITATELSLGAGYDRSLICRMRHGRLPNFATLVDILETLGLDIVTVERPVPFIRHREKA